MKDKNSPVKKVNPLKGGRKGGTRFPQINLEKAVQYAEKLVQKTHIGPQPSSNIFPGVFGTAGPEGSVRASALKQFGLLEGDTSAYKATEIAKSIVAALPEEKTSHLRKCCLLPSVFRGVFETFHGDSVTTAKIRQKILSLDVHPDLADKAVGLFIASTKFAGLATEVGDSITFVTLDSQDTNDVTAEGDNGSKAKNDDPSDEATGDSGKNITEEQPSKKSGFNVSLSLDSTMDSDKLEKQLALLRRYGVI